MARPAGNVERLVKWARRRPVHAALAGLAALFVVTVAGLLWPRPQVIIEPPRVPGGTPTGLGVWQERVPGAGPLAGRWLHSMVWTGRELILWGGLGGIYFDDGARYDPMTGAWKLVSKNGAPAQRSTHSAVWTGSEMLIWGGSGEHGEINDGARYDPATDTWRPMNAMGAPVGRSSHSTVWTGTQMIVWWLASRQCYQRRRLLRSGEG